MAEGLDFSWGRPGPAAIVAAGRVFVCRYLGPARFGGKGMTRDEMQAYLNAGLAVVLNFESSGTNTTSFANGVADAKYAQGEAVALGYPNAVIYFSNDKQDTTGLVDYLRGVESVIGHARTGLYAGIGGIQVAQGAGVAAWFWQTYAWSGGKVAPGVHIYQYRNGQTINGASVDFNRNLQDPFGQIGGGATPASNGGTSSPVQHVTVNRSVQDIQRAVGAAVDGVWGPETDGKVKAFQSSHGLVPDGIWGPLSDAAAFGKPGPNLAVDGQYGPATIRAEQAALGVAQDGIRGPRTIEAEQRRTGAKIDGVDGPDTVRHLQARLNGVIGAGLAVDGKRGSATVSALQRALNAGRF